MNFIPHTDQDRREMLAALDIDQPEKLFADIPAAVRLQRPLAVAGGLSEMELAKHLSHLAGMNANLDEYSCFLGAGAYDHYVPSVVRQILSRAEFYTAYTPYQPEISQGTLQSIFEYQSMICTLTGMDAANASMYDGASAMAEAGLMACAATRRKKVVAARSLHPDYRAVARTYFRGPAIELVEAPCTEGLLDQAALSALVDQQTAAVLVQYPSFLGTVENLAALAELAHQAGALLVVGADPIALALLKSPGNCGADIVVGEGQPLGIPLSFGGPYLGFLACREKYLRKMPGRIVGQTTDVDGRRAFVLTLQAREQHIRRDKATSNICSNEALCALAATVYLSLLGKAGLAEVAGQCLTKAHYAAAGMAALPHFSLAWQSPFYKEFVVKVPFEPAEINQRLIQDKIIGGYDLGQVYPELERHMLFCVTEKRTRLEIDRLVDRLGAMV